MKFVTCIAALFIATNAAFAGESLNNPRLLLPPLKLTRAEYYMDGGSLGGTLTDCRGNYLDFFFDRSLDKENAGKIFIGFRSGHGRESMEANYLGWTKEDLFQMIEMAIRQQFVWDAAANDLRAKNEDDVISKGLVGNFHHLKFILRYVEYGLNRHPSFMQ
jgi:hypothetical protein